MAAIHPVDQPLNDIYSFASDPKREDNTMLFGIEHLENASAKCLDNFPFAFVAKPDLQDLAINQYLDDSRPWLYEGEDIGAVYGYPCIFKYIPPRCSAPTLQNTQALGSAQLPLVVLIPGGAHNARVFYGGHSGFRRQDFLAFWLSKLGFPVLAISYPLDNENINVRMPSSAAAFRITDWGRQAAVVTKRVVDQHPALAGRDILLAGWSMGGRIMAPYTEVATRVCGLRVGMFVSLAATPGIGGMRPAPPGIRCTRNGYGDCDGLLELFQRQIREQSAYAAQYETDDEATQSNGVDKSTSTSPATNATREARHLIPTEDFVTSYFGYTPVSLHGWQLSHSHCPQTNVHKFVPDKWGSEEDAAPKHNDFTSLPWLASITGTSAADARHVLLDQLTWKYLNAQRLTAIWEKWAKKEKRELGSREISPNPTELVGAKKTATTECDSTWTRFSAFVDEISGRHVLHECVEGNHYFFLGRQGASTTAMAIHHLWKQRCELQTRLEGILPGETV